MAAEAQVGLLLMSAFAEPQFDLTEDTVDDRTHVITVSGEIHVSTAPTFSLRLNDAIGQGKTAVVLDLADVTFIDSTGLSVLLNGLRRVTRRGGRMAIVCTNPTVLRLFEITRLDTTFEIVRSREEALRAVGDGEVAQDGGSSDGPP
jgi:anti-sigma B factor antagonist